MNTPTTPQLAGGESMTSPQARFAELLARHRGIVLEVAHSYCRHPQDRQDLAQEIAAQLWRAYPRYDSARPFTTWMYRVALNVAISGVRTAAAQGRGVPLDAALEADEALWVEDGTASADNDRALAALHAVIDRQSPLDRALLLLWLDERPQREIADVLGLSESNVATKLQRLRQRIRLQLEQPDRPAR
jgi:RNA polymerase sigma-70 factor (ECF subfamily)